MVFLLNVAHIKFYGYIWNKNITLWLECDSDRERERGNFNLLKHVYLFTLIFHIFLLSFFNCFFGKFNTSSWRHTKQRNIHMLQCGTRILFCLHLYVCACVCMLVYAEHCTLYYSIYTCCYHQAAKGVSKFRKENSFINIPQDLYGTMTWYKCIDWNKALYCKVRWSRRIDFPKH